MFRDWPQTCLLVPLKAVPLQMSFLLIFKTFHRRHPTRRRILIPCSCYLKCRLFPNTGLVRTTGRLFVISDLISFISRASSDMSCCICCFRSVKNVSKVSPGYWLVVLKLYQISVMLRLPYNIAWTLVLEVQFYHIRLPWMCSFYAGSPTTCRKMIHWTLSSFESIPIAIL